MWTVQVSLKTFASESDASKKEGIKVMHRGRELKVGDRAGDEY
jgi:hypothetical protein